MLLGDVVHAVVDKMPESYPDGWAIGGAIATIAAAVAASIAAIASAAAAIYTSILAQSTKLLADETGKVLDATVKATAAEDRRHQEALQPHIALRVNEANGIPAVWAHNVGPGFARNVTFRIIDGSPQQGASLPLPSLPLAIEPGGLYPIAPQANIKFYDIEIEYFDAFANSYRTWAKQFPMNRQYLFERVVRLA